MFVPEDVVVFEVGVPLYKLAVAVGNSANAVPKIANEAAMTATASLAFIVHGMNLCNIRGI